jgi:SCY1-like protein 2
VDAALQTLSVILATLDFSTIKNEVFPVIAHVFSKTSSLGIKIRGLEALKVLCGGGPEPEGADDDFTGLNGSKKPKTNSVILDKYTIQERVVPLLKAIKTKEPAVMTAALDVFREIGKVADSDFLATDVLPILWNFSLGPLLNLQQFQAFMTLIRSLSTKIEQDHTRKLQELSSSSSQTVASRNDLMSFGNLPGSGSNGIDDSNGDSFDFEQLVLGGKRATMSSTQDTMDAWGSSAVSSRTSTQKTATAAPTFSWSTPQAQDNTVGSNRGNTNSLGGFGVLQPTSASSSTSAFSQPLQPSKPQTSPGLQTKPVEWSSGTTNAWSAASNAASSPASNPWNAASPANTISSNTWSSAANTSTNAWSSAAPTPPASNYNMGSSMNTLQPNKTSTAGWSISTPPASSSPFSTFSIAPPPPMNSMQSKIANDFSSGSGRGSMQSQSRNQSHTQQSNVGEQKSGLDKYESLL